MKELMRPCLNLPRSRSQFIPPRVSSPCSWLSTTATSSTWQGLAILKQPTSGSPSTTTEMTPCRPWRFVSDVACGVYYVIALTLTWCGVCGRCRTPTTTSTMKPEPWGDWKILERSSTCTRIHEVDTVKNTDWDFSEWHLDHQVSCDSRHLKLLQCHPVGGCGSWSLFVNIADPAANRWMKVRRLEFWFDQKHLKFHWSESEPAVSHCWSL